MKICNSQEAYAALQAESDAILVDVRSRQEVEQGMPEGATHIALLEIVDGRRVGNPDFIAQIQGAVRADQPLYLLCRVGGRSQHAAMLLEQCGFTNVTNVDGGFSGRFDPQTGTNIAGWSQVGLPVVIPRNDMTV